MTQPTQTAEHHAPLLALTADETQAVIKGALIFYAGEGAMDGDTYHALHDALVKLFPAKATTEVKP
ncbi:hypothetical protein [Micromonospora chokoriensis]|uniref:hypothetical protein n=1 Tax=Micromonospora chokoriensis TaxID=356851 RepID=UPI0004C3C54A|nr:hypothetical protein [Micromonospora chokoriensis]